MRAVMSFSQRLVVLVSGKKIADGDAGRRDPRSRSGEGLPWPVASPSRTSTPATARCACSRTSRSTSMPGETVVLLGTNGNGKSTLMKCIMGIVRPQRRPHRRRDRRRAARSRRPHHRGDRRSRHRAGAGRPPAVSAAHRRGEPAARRLPHEGARRRSRPNLDVLLRDASRGWPSAARQLAGSMSGGEQQMLALGARADAGAADPADRRAVGRAWRRCWSAAPSTRSRS